MALFSRLIEAKLKAARRGTRGPRCPSEAPDRIPPGQRVVDNFPVLDLGLRPAIGRGEWRLTVEGEVERPFELSWAELMALPQTEVTVDIHCVTHWSRLDVPWIGVRLREVLDRASPRAGARHVLLSSADGYSTNLPLADLLREDVLLAHTVDGASLSREHGGPVRLLAPHRYFWKSAKWLTGLRITARDAPGFWETRGYHNRADPWQEERYGRG